MLQWDEDKWEDISDPPSPVLSKTRHTFSSSCADSKDFGHLTEKIAYQNGGVSVDKTGTNERQLSGDSECWNLLQETHHQKAARSNGAKPVLIDVQQFARELLESYKVLPPLRNDFTEYSDHDDHFRRHSEALTGICIDDYQTYQGTASSKPKSFEGFRTKFGSEKKPKTSQKIKDTGQKIGLKGNRNKTGASNQQAKQGVKTARVISSKVPQSLCKTTSSSRQSQQKEALHIKSTTEQANSSPSSAKEKVTTRDYNLKEYKKLSSHQHILDRYTILNNYHTSDSIRRELYDLEDEDRAKAIVCVVFCIMGLGLIVGMVCLLSRFTEPTEPPPTEILGDDANYTELMNQVYYRRVADVIRQAAQTETTLRHDTQKLNIDSASSQLCDVAPPNLLGNTTDIQFNQTLDIDDIVTNNSDVMEGGEWKPPLCISRSKVAIIIPYRDRWNHLKVLLHYLIPTLKRQQIHFRIFVVEQFGNDTFNKGRIMNAAFREALKLFDFQCVTFHDVDLVPEDDRNMYTCTEQPKHMSHSIDKFKYVLPYQGLVGGVLMFKREHFQLVNGYSNMYWGWGAEDDDMTTRILHNGLRIYRPPSNIAKYKMVKHDGRKSSEVAVRMRLLRTAAKRNKLEGLNNVKYSLLHCHTEKLFTHFVVDIGLP